MVALSPRGSVLVGWLGARLLAAGIARLVDDPGDRPYALAQLAAASTAMLESPCWPPSLTP